MKKRLQFICLFFISLFCGCSNSSQKDFAEIKLGYVMSAGGASHEGALEFARLVKERTQGKIQVKIYSNGQLGMIGK